MTTRYEIPLVPRAQELTIALGGIDYSLTIHWCSPANAWIIDIADKNGVAILTGIPLVTGTDLLAPFAYLNFGGQLIASTDNNADAVPTYSNLGSTGHLYFDVP